MKLSVPSLLAQLAVVTTLCLSGVLGENVSSQEFKLEGDALLQKRDFLGASRSYTRAIGQQTKQGLPKATQLTSIKHRLIQQNWNLLPSSYIICEGCHTSCNPGYLKLWRTFPSF